MDLSKEFITKQKELLKLSQLMANASIDVKEQYTIKYINNIFISNQPCPITDDEISQIVNSERDTLYKTRKFPKRDQFYEIYETINDKLISRTNFIIHYNQPLLNNCLIIPFLAKLAKKYNYDIQFIMLISANFNIEVNYNDITDNDIKKIKSNQKSLIYKIHFNVLDSGGI